MQKINASVPIHWHPVFNYPISMAEVGVHGEAITETGRGIDDMKVAAELLIAKLGATNYKANKQTFEHANSDYFDPTRPPFAIEMKSRRLTASVSFFFHDYLVIL